MSTLLLALTTYGVTIVFALLVAIVIQALGAVVSRLPLERNDAPVDLHLPAADARPDAEAVAVAIAVANAARAGRLPAKAQSSTR